MPSIGWATARICAAERIRSSNLAVLLRELDAAGYIKRASDQKDRRCTRLSLTAKGRRALHGNRAVRGKWLASAMLGGLTADERERVIEAGVLLERLSRFRDEGASWPAPTSKQA